MIFIDSIKKLWQWIKGVDLDNDFRKRFNRKLFVIIFKSAERILKIIPDICVIFPNLDIK